MRYVLLFVLMAGFAVGFAQKGHRIEIDIKGYEEPQLYLAYYLGDKQYILDTVQREKSGSYIFQGDEPLKCGFYLVVMAPDNNFFQMLIRADEQRFSISTDKGDLVKKAKVKSSPENELFFTYLSYLGEKRPAADALGKEIEAAGEDAAKKADLQKKLDKLNEEVAAYQRDLMAKHPNSLTAATIKSSMPLEFPEFKGDEQEQRIQQWHYTKQHYFDYMDLTNECLLRSPFLHQRIDYFLNKLHVQHPDSIAKALDLVLERMRPAPETFKYYLIQFLNTYARSNFVGMDAVYVHLVENYYTKGDAPWVEEEQMRKITDNAKTLKPLLIGKRAPDLQLETRDGKPFRLHEVEAPYTVVYFWRHDCGHCKKSSPYVKAFQEKFKDKGVKVVGVCVKFQDEIADCWKYVEENELNDWIHLVDPYGRSRFTKIYDLTTTPQIYIFDAQKTIISKKIGAEQLEEVMDKIIEMKKAEEKTK